MRIAGKNPYINFLVFAVMLVSLNACNDFFIQDLEIPRQDLDRQMVVHAFISDMDTTLNLKIANNFGLDDSSTEEESLISDATVRVFAGDGLIHEFTGDGGLYQLELQDHFGFNDELYRLEVSHPEYETLVAETTMPAYVMPENVTFKRKGGFSRPGTDDKLDLIEITFTDPADEENYYEFQIYQILVYSEEIIFGQDTFVTEYRYPDIYFTPDVNFEQGVSGFMISDELFNGQSYTIQVMVRSDQDFDEIPVEKLRVAWNCISKDHYEFSKTLLRYQNSANFGLFSDPIAIYSNIDNGLGIFSLRSSRILPLEEK
jgi:hypothetical protein